MAKGRGGRGGGAGPAPFLTKTYQMVEERATDEVISWAEPGRNFVVWKPVEFARDLLPIHFKHCNFSSFVRQLNTYVRTHSASFPLLRLSFPHFYPVPCLLLHRTYLFFLFISSIDI
jgi:hypothetical protein